MNEAAGKQMTPEVKRWLETWKMSVQDVLSQVAGKKIELAASEEHLPVLADDVWYTVTSAGGAIGEMSLRLPAATGSILAQILLGEAEPKAGELSAERKEALDELLRQIAGQAATALKSASGEVKLQVAGSSAPGWAAEVFWSYQTASDAAVPVALELQLSAALLATLSLQARPEATPVPVPEALPVNYERLMDVDLEVKLRFGARRMELREVLALSPGAVVELDRTLQAPVDLLLDGRVIALGEVVVVDGKYGLRVTEVLDPGSAA